jgi:two-component system NarL family sensor kinase
MSSVETKIIIAILIAVSIVAFFLAYFIFNIVRYQKKNNALHLQKLEAEIRSGEKERKRIASNLHDDIGPVLASMKMQLRTLNTDKTNTGVVDQATIQIDRLLQNIRTLSHDLSPVALERKGLFTAMHDYVFSVNRTNDFHIDFDCPQKEMQMSENVAIDIYRILQEAVHNTIKHAGTDRMRIRMQTQINKTLYIEISDDGLGFNTEEVMQNGEGLGLKNMISRVELLGGNIYVDSTPGIGTKYQIQIPLA